jgi:hypothetical protein
MVLYEDLASSKEPEPAYTDIRDRQDVLVVSQDPAYTNVM